MYRLGAVAWCQHYCSAAPSWALGTEWGRAEGCRSTGPCWPRTLPREQPPSSPLSSCGSPSDGSSGCESTPGTKEALPKLFTRFICGLKKEPSKALSWHGAPAQLVLARRGRTTQALPRLRPCQESSWDGSWACGEGFFRCLGGEVERWRSADTSTEAACVVSHCRNTCGAQHWGFCPFPNPNSCTVRSVAAHRLEGTQGRAGSSKYSLVLLELADKGQDLGRMMHRVLWRSAAAAGCGDGDTGGSSTASEGGSCSTTQPRERSIWLCELFCL